MTQATARHILVETEEQCLSLKKEIEDGLDFAEAAKTNSSCPSGGNGGDLGSFSPGQMVKEFNDVVFTGELNKVHGPVQTQFGWHILYLEDKRIKNISDDVIRNQVVSILKERKVKVAKREWLAKLKDQAYIEIIE